MYAYGLGRGIPVTVTENGLVAALVAPFETRIVTPLHTPAGPAPPSLSVTPSVTV